MVSSSQKPADATPYWLMLIRMVPKLMTEAGMNSDSVGWRKLARNVEG